MIERLRADLDAQELRIDDHLRRLGYLEGEADRTRKRLHRMENDRRAVQALVRTTQKLADQTRALAAQVSAGVAQGEQLAEAAAEKAIAKAAERRSSSRWRLAGRLATHLAAVGSFGALVAYIVHAAVS
jgi:hypothetical protein